MKIDHVAQCRFFTAEDACRIALQAYYAADRHLQPPSGEPWFLDGSPYAVPSDFAEAFEAEVRARLSLLALDRLGNFDIFTALWDVYSVASNIEPEKMAPLIEANEIEKSRIDAEFEADFLRDEMNRLPAGDNAVHNQLSEGVGNAG